MKYTVEVTETITYLIPVEADNEEDAAYKGARRVAEEIVDENDELEVSHLSIEAVNVEEDKA